MVEKRGVTPLILNHDTKLKLEVNSTLPLLCAKEKSHRYPPNRKLDGLQNQHGWGSEYKEQTLPLMLFNNATSTA
jgi:hypothetical protein